MNGLVGFRKCTLTDEELLKKVDSMTDEIYQTRKIPNRHIPARLNEDYDLLIGEVVVRFLEKDRNICYKDQQPCKYECDGLCKEAQ